MNILGTKDGDFIISASKDEMNSISDGLDLLAEYAAALADDNPDDGSLLEWFESIDSMCKTLSMGGIYGH